ncbi:tripartite tricarboxylate transporter TctB family protein [Arthrobacter pigmenti]
MKELLQRRPVDVWAGAVVTVLGIAYTLIAQRIPPDPSSVSVIGPSYVPTFLGLVLTGCGIALIVMGIRRGSVDLPTDSAGAPADEAVAKTASAETSPRVGSLLRRNRLWALLAMFGIYIWIFIPVGYLVSTAVFLIALTSYFNLRQWRSNVLYAVIFPVLVYVLFEHLLQVPLPPGILRGVLP